MNGRKIYQILDEQGFNWHDYGRQSVTAANTYLYSVVNAYNKNAVTFRINSCEDGTFMIDNGINNTEYTSYKMYVEGIDEEALAETFIQLIEKNVDLSNLEG